MSNRTKPAILSAPSTLPSVAPAQRIPSCVLLDIEIPRAAPHSALATLESWSADLDLRDIQSRFGSCLWIVSAPQLRRNLAAWTTLAGAADRVCYPVKANPSPAILEILAAAGARAECASPTEILLARLAGFPAERLVYGSPAPDLDAAWQLLVEGGTVVADSADMLRALDARAAAGASPAPSARLLVRVNPSIDIRYRRSESWSELTSHARRNGKFGIPSEEIPGLLADVRHLQVSGLHAHVGTQMDHEEPFLALAEHLQSIASEIARTTAHRITILDLGGGLGIPFTDNSVSRIYSSHMFEHLTYSEAQGLLDECMRALKPGGSFSIVVPNAGMYIEGYVGQRDLPSEYFGWEPAYNRTTRIDALNYVAYMAGEHKYMFDQENLLHILTAKGFVNVSARAFDPETDMQERDFESIYAIGYKPDSAR